VVGSAIRYEDLNGPSGSPDYNGPAQALLPVSAFRCRRSSLRQIGLLSGSTRRSCVSSLKVRSGSGRYDHYSTGQAISRSPKVGAKFTPIPQVAIRGTFSRAASASRASQAGALYRRQGYVAVGCKFAIDFASQPTLIWSWWWGKPI
jgi:iron complex outermembrane receptor protein